MHRTELLADMESILEVEYRQLGNLLTRVEVTPGVGMTLSDGPDELSLSDDGVRSLLGYAKIPERMIPRISGGTGTSLVNELLARKGATGLLIHKDEGIVEVLSHRESRQMPVEKVLDTLERIIPETEYVRPVLMPNRCVQLEVIGAETEAVAAGDIIKAGVAIRFSPVGIMDPEIQTFVQRLVCTNGMTSTSVLKNFILGSGDDDDLWQWFEGGVTEAYNSLSDVIGKYRHLIGEKLEPKDRARLLAGLLNKAQPGAVAQEAIHARMVEEPPENSYDVLNLVSWASSHVIQEPKRILKTQRAVAAFTDEDTHSHLCAVCHR